MTSGADRVVAAPPAPGLARIEARFSGSAFSLHRHDTYAIGLTLSGVQSFFYRGAVRHSLPGEIIVLHPDEVHDGGAGSETGLSYRMLYLDPALVSACLDRSDALPFVALPVLRDPAFRTELLAVLGALDEPIDDLLLDDTVAAVTQALSRHAGEPVWRDRKIAFDAAHRARALLTEAGNRNIGSAELERLTGLDRYALARHFRAAFGTSPHRFLVMRRLERARDLLARGEPAADVAAATGFADQSHLNRHFRRAFGMTPGRWARLTKGGGRLGCPAPFSERPNDTLTTTSAP